MLDVELRLSVKVCTAIVTNNFILAVNWFPWLSVIPQCIIMQ